MIQDKLFALWGIVLIFLNSFSMGLKLQMNPVITVTGRQWNYTTSSLEDSHVYVITDENSILVTGSIFDMTVECKAPYRIQWKTSQHVISKMSPVVGRRIVDNPQDPETFQYFLSVTYSGRGLIGYIGKCQGQIQSQNQSDIYNLTSNGSHFSTKLHIFSPDIFRPDSIFVSGRQNKIVNHRATFYQNGELGPSFRIPCPRMNLDDKNPTLLKISNKGEKDEKRIQNWAEYDPNSGFFIPTNGATRLKGTFQCIASEETNPASMIFEFSLTNKSTGAEGDMTTGQTEEEEENWLDLDEGETFPSGIVTGGSGEIDKNGGTPQILLTKNKKDFICQNVNETVTKQLLLRRHCRSLIHCEILQSCFTYFCPYKVAVGDPCVIGKSCLTLETRGAHGTLKCTSGPQQIHMDFFIGLDRIQYFTWETPPKQALIQIDEFPTVLYTNTEHFFYCEASNFLFIQDIQFLILFKNTSKLPLPQEFKRYSNDRMVQRKKVYPIVGIGRGVWINVTGQMAGIICLAPWSNSSEWMESLREFNIRDIVSPKIGNFSKERIFYVGEEHQTLICSAQSEPKATIHWMSFDEQGIERNLSAGFRTELKGDGGSILEFPKISENLQGSYICVAINGHGNDSLAFDIQIRNSRVNNRIVIGVSITALIFLLALMILLRKYFQTRKKLRNLTPDEIKEFEKGNPDALKNSGSQTSGENIQYLPFNKNYEIRETDFIIHKDKVLGSGEYGVVYAGKLRESPVAIKTTKSNTDVTYFKAFLKEIKVMTFIGEHKNIIKLLGTVTNKIHERIVYIVVELSELGSLESFLKIHRASFRFISPSIKAENGRDQYKNMFSIVITSKDLVKWCAEIAEGMSYLASKQIIHGDLATRNILLFDGLTAKITDFGLSRQMYNTLNYVKKQQVPLPWRSMPPEALRDMKFSTWSDVWSFGVTAWEIFSLGAVPYLGMSLSLDFMDALEQGLRLKQPEIATEEIYENMLLCWDLEPESRPSFDELTEFYSNALHRALEVEADYQNLQ